MLGLKECSNKNYQDNSCKKVKILYCYQIIPQDFQRLSYQRTLKYLNKKQEEVNKIISYIFQT